MPRHADADLRKDWKICIPATLAGAVEFELFDPLTKKPRYGQRSKLIARLLSVWLTERAGRYIPVDPLDHDLEASFTSKPGSTSNARG